MSSSLDETFGAAYIGIVVAAMLLGISVIQGFYYFTHHEDRWILRGLVVAVLIFDLIHQILITHTGWVYLVSFSQQPAKLGTVIWSLLAEVLFNGLTAFCVQCFLTYRIWKLSGAKVWLTTIVISFVLSEFACVIAFAIIAFLRVKTFEQLSAELKGLSVTVNAVAVAGDLFIAGILTLLLQRSKTGFRKSDTMINKLIIFAVNTGGLTSICAVASLISILAAPATFIYISFFFSMGRLYTNSLLANLNARSMIRKAAEGINTITGDASISFKDYARHASSSKLVFQHSRNLNATNISIQVDTTREFMSDLERNVVSRDGCLSDFKHGEAEIEEELSEVNLSNGDIESNISDGVGCTAV
ncbi:hypothetical protein GGU10DRAFT_350006 [Lentinula aff. detonsa]|uniref:DUF6534 domain-containing protein n=1 Tax=Lentinula aff. detonsa TaxID=2804958 RepID=A0AA38NKA7_9AGAR|nr:hypothetical protein GGU10DRAFT_350006 [Lentinula aff. detonsa]